MADLGYVVLHQDGHCLLCIGRPQFIHIIIIIIISLCSVLWSMHNLFCNMKATSIGMKHFRMHDMGNVWGGGIRIQGVYGGGI